MYPRGPYDRRIELRGRPFFHPRVKSLLLLAAIGVLGGGGYVLARSHLIDATLFGSGLNPFQQSAVADARSTARPLRQSPQQPPAGSKDSAALSQGVKPTVSNDHTTPSKNVKSAYPSPDPPSDASNSTSHAAPPQNVSSPYKDDYKGQVLGASTEADPSQYVTKGELSAVLEEKLNERLAPLAALVPALRQLITQFPANNSASQTSTVYVPTYSGPAFSTPVNTQTFAQGQKIDRLSGTTLSNVIVDGVSGLTDADIPDSITASNYLALSGGTLSGDLAMSGTLTAGTLSVSAVSSGGAVIAPYFTATSTTQTSDLQNLTATNATTSLLFVKSAFSSPQATIGSLLATSSFSTPQATIGSLTLGFLTATSTSQFSTFAGGFISQASSTFTGDTYFPGGIWTSSGNVGIGTTSPGSKLDVWTASGQASSDLTGLNVHNQTDVFSGTARGIYGYADGGTGAGSAARNRVGVEGYASTNSGTGYVYGVKGSAGSSASLSTDIFGGYFALTSNPVSAGGLASALVADNGATTGDIFNGRDNSSSVFVIKDGGNVGIGTTTPAHKLVIGNGTTNTRLYVSGAAGGSDATARPTIDDAQIELGRVNTQQGGGIQFNLLGSGSGYGWKLAAPNYTSGPDSGSFLFLHRQNSATWSEFMRITAAGNVGIGTTSPGQKLHIENGNIQFSNGYGLQFFDLSGGDSNYSRILGNTSSGLSFYTGDSERVTVTSAGNVGIGTTSPSTKLHVYNGSGDSILRLGVTGGTYDPKIQFFRDDGSVVGASVWMDNSAQALYLDNQYASPNGNIYIRTQTNGTPVNAVSILGTGNVGIGTTSPSSFKLQVKGNVGPDAATTYNLGSAALNWASVYYDSGCMGTCPSDESLKTGIQDLVFENPLDQVAGLRLRSFAYKSATSTIYHGLIAQEAEAVAPELVVTDASTTLKKVKYGEIQWLMLSALQKLIAKVNDLATTVASFADHFTTKELTFTRATGTELDVQKLCVTDAPNDPNPVCVTKPQLAALLSQSAAAALPNPSPNPAANTSTSTSANQFPNPSPDAEAPADAASLTPPVIRINGANPAHINIGDTYNDLGATITGPQADLNLGIKTFLNGALVSDIIIDTTQPATDTIDYVVTDQNGLTSTSTRTVIIEAPQTPAASASSTTTQ